MLVHTRKRLRTQALALFIMIKRKMSRNQLFLIGGAMLGIVALLVTIVTVAALRPTDARIGMGAGDSQPSQAGAANGPSGKKMILGYYLEAATGSNCPGIPAMSPDKIPAQYYTHLIYGFSPLINTKTWELNAPTTFDANRYKQFNDLKKTHTGLQTLLSLGGDLPDISPMSRMASDPTTRQHFVKTTIGFVRKYGFDGIDIDWEFPADVSRGGSLNDTEGFVSLVQEFRSQIDAEERAPEVAKLLLSAIVPGGQYWGQYYAIDRSITYLDFVNILAYNVLGTWRGITDCSAPLENPQDINQDSAANALRYFISEAKQAGAGPEKFNFGISFWAISFKLHQALNATTVISPPTGTLAYTGAEQPATPGFCTKQPGYLAYFEVIRLINTTRSTRVDEDPVSVCKYFTYDRDQWVGYDDTFTFNNKIDYALGLGMSGVSVWGMDADNPDTFELTKFLSAKVNH